MNRKISCVFVLALAPLGQIVEGQTMSDPNPRLGFQPGGVYSLNDIESLNQVNGNLTLRIPIGSLGPDRAGASHGVGLIYNSKIWEPAVVQNGDPTNGIEPASAGGWTYQIGYELEQLTRPGFDGNSCPPQGTEVPSDMIYTQKLSVVFPDGSAHLLRLYAHPESLALTDNAGDGYYQFGPNGLGLGACQTPTTNASVPNPMVYYTTDGTFLRLTVSRDSTNDITSWTLSFKNGDYVQGGGGNPQLICDHNSNCVSLDSELAAISNNPSSASFTDGYFTNISDEFGRTISISYNSCTQNCALTDFAGGTDTITVPAFGNSTALNTSASLTWTVQWTYYSGSGSTIQYSCQDITTGEWGSCGRPDPGYMVTQITPPAAANLGPYLFAYSTTNATWGELSSITLPTGTVANYTYWLNSPGTGNCSSTAATVGIPQWFDVLADYPCYKKVYWSGNTSAPPDETQSFVINQSTSDFPSATVYKSSVLTGPDGGVTTTKFNNCAGFTNPNCYGYNVGAFPGNWQSGLVNEIDEPDGTVITKTWAENTLYGTGLGYPSPSGCQVVPLCSQWFPYDSQNPYVQTETRTPASGSPATTTYTVDRNGNPLVTCENDFGGPLTCSPTTPPGIRRTTLTYYNSTTDAATTESINEPNTYWNSGAASLLSLPNTKRVDGPTGSSPSSYEQLCYDGSATPTVGNVTFDARLVSGSPGTIVTCASGTVASNAVATQFTYGTKGLVEVSMDARTIATNVAYANTLYPSEKDDACSQSLAAGATCTLAEARKTSYTTDLNSGKTMSVTDLDNSTTTSTGYDVFGRVTSVTDALGATTSTQYQDSSPRYVKTTPPLNLGVSANCFDQLGRLVLTQLSETGSLTPCTQSTGVINTTRQYAYGSSGGRFEWISNPYRSTSDATMGWLLRNYDVTGRLVQEGHFSTATAPSQTATPDSKVTYSYAGPCYTIKDEAANASNSSNPGSVKTICQDAAGRISSVVENGYTTSYNYDGLDHLTSVTQGTQPPRTFSYDAMGRLISTTNPENGTISYGYDNGSNLIVKGDQRPGVYTCFGPVSGASCSASPSYGINNGYDALNRAITKNYTDGTPGVTYSYCNNTCTIPYARGRMISEAVSGGATVNYNQFDADGRVKAHSQGTQVNGGPSFPFTYVYNAASLLTSETYPSLRVVNNTYDAAGRLLTLGSGATTYAGNSSSGIQYAPHGGISGMTLGNTLVESWTYNPRLQPTAISLGTTSQPSSIRGLTMGYGTAENNGNLLAHGISGTGVSSTASQSYMYDGANRLVEGSEGSSWSRNFGYDQFGNGWVSAASGITASSFTPTNSSAYNSSTNRLTTNGSSYDGAGNLTGVGSYTFTYDAESRLATSALSGETTAYLYDGDGKRVAKVDCTGTGTCTPTSANAVIVTWYVYDVEGNLVAEYGPGSMTGCTTCYVTADALGSRRVVTSGTGSVAECHDYQPFGEEILGVGGRSGCYGNDPMGLLFTGQYRDAETQSSAMPSGLDYFGARYFSGAMGRFTSPDPSGLLAVKLTNPQSWNLYAYAMNNPLINIDPTGLDCVSATDSNGGYSVNHDTDSGGCGKAGGTWVPGYVDENWVHFNNNNGQYQVGSIDGAGKNSTVDYATFAAGAQTDTNGNCTSGCGGYGFASQNANFLQGQLVGNSISGGLDGYIQFLTSREQPLSGGIAMQILAGPLNPSTDHWAGPGGMGPPGGQGDWTASMHDYNFSTNGPEPGKGITIGMYFNPILSPAVSKALIQSNSTLIRNAGGVQGVKMGLFFGAVNAFQWYANSWK